MPITSIEDAFAAGAHRSVEQVIGRGVNDISEARRVLENRYGSEYQLSPVEHAILVGRVQDAVRAAGLYDRGHTPLDAEIPSVSGSGGKISYTVIGSIEIDDPVTGERSTISIPWTIRDDKILTTEELRNIALQELLEFRGARYDSSNPNAFKQDMKDRVFQRERDSSTNPGEAIKIDILSVYRS